MKYYKEMSILECSVPEMCTGCGVLIRLVATAAVFATEGTGPTACGVIPVQT
jgi:hypothetical protein